jgi:hypothetical protein
MSLLIPGTNSIKDTGYDVANSLRFDDASDDYLSRSISSTGNRRTWTWSGWVKRSNTTQQYQNMMSMGSNNIRINFSNQNIWVYDYNGSGFDFYLVTNALFRDVSAWMHIVVAVDTTQGTASNRVKLYINGVQETSFSTETYPSQNHDTEANTSGQNNVIGTAGDSLGNNGFHGYMAEIVLIDGQALDPTSFGEFDEDSPNIWKPKNVSGLTFGTNGFYLDFEDSSALGNDAAGSNNFTVNNLTAIDQSTDTCTNNFATANPLANIHGAATFSEGNLKVSGDAAANNNWQTTFLVSSGKWYWELKNLISDSDMSLLYYNQSTISGSHPGYGFVCSSKKKIIGGSVTGSAIGSAANNDIWSVALDLDNGKMFIARNGTYLSSGDPANGTNPFIQTSDGLPTEGVFGGHVYNGSVELNFGGGTPTSISSGNADDNGYGNFEYDVPAGFYSLCTKNLAEFG